MKASRFFPSRFRVLATFSLVCSTSLSSGGTLYWDNYDTTGDLPGNSAWEVAANWSSDPSGTPDAAAAPVAGDDLIFSASSVTADQTVNLNANRTVNSVTFTSSFATTILSGTSGGSPYTLNLGAGGITVNSGAGASTIGSGASDGVPIRMNAAQSWINNSTNTLSIRNSVAFANNLGEQTLTVGGTGNTTISAEVRNANTAGGTTSTLSLTKTGTGTLSLSGTNSNAYTGLTTVSGGTLSLSKSTSGTTAIAGNVLVNGGALNWGSSSNQVADTSNIQMTSGSMNLNSRTETIADLSISGGQMTTGAGNFTANSISLTPSSASTLMIVSTAATVTTNSLTLSGTARPLGGTSAGGNLLIGGNSTTTQTRVVIGSGGLSMNGQVIQYNLVSSEALGSRLELNGGFTGSGTNVIGFATSGSGTDTTRNAIIDLGADDRTFTIVNGTTTVELPVTGTGGLQKTGAGTLVLGGQNTFAGDTTVDNGVLRVTGALNNSTSLTVTNGTFAYGADDAVNDGAAVNLGAGAILQTNDFSDALGVLAVTGSAELALGGGDSILSFADSSAEDWTSGALAITGWTGLETGGGSEQVLVAGQGLTPGQLAAITFVNPLGFDPGIYSAKFVGDELVPDALIPEPSTLIVFLSGTAGLLVRRRRIA